MYRRDRMMACRSASAVGLLGAALIALPSVRHQPAAYGEATSAASPAPTAAPTATAAPSPTDSQTPMTTPSATAAPNPTATGTGVVVDHYVFAPVPAAGQTAQYGRADQPLLGVARLDTIRVRFRLRNKEAGEQTVRPRLEFRRAGTTYVAVPDVPTPSAAVHITREWVSVRHGRGGTVLGPPDEPIAVADLRLGNGRTNPAVRGDHSMAANPAAPLTLPAGAATEQEFTIRLGMAADFATTYELRVTDAGGVAINGGVATIRLGPKPRLRLSAGQRSGVDVPDQRDTARLGYGRGIAFPLVVTSRLRATLVGDTTTGTVHGPYSMTTDECALCHRAHTAAGPNLLTRSAPTSSLCFNCHDGTGATDVRSQYTDPSVPADDPVGREYYRHDTLVPSAHTLAQNDEFGGVSNRHADCADCHNAHQTHDTDSSAGDHGWTSSGRLAGTSGVAVVNGAAGTPPAYTFLDGIVSPATLEYQLCFKCHSGFTVLPSNDGVSPSRYELDKGVEFNPANGSYHPVEAAGTNQTTKMGDSLSGTSPYKLWNFTSTGTVRCTSCHAGGGVGGSPTAGSDLPTHTSSYRGLLLRNYRDRVLLSAQAPYSAGNFALCYVCHAEAPYVNETTEATNFPYHGLHVADLAGKGSGGTDIDTPGDGQGNALCSECHFRLHSTTYKTGAQSVSGQRLVNFAPNVEGVSGASSAPVWEQKATGGTCTLVCHGYQHKAMTY